MKPWVKGAAIGAGFALSGTSGFVGRPIYKQRQFSLRFMTSGPDLPSVEELSTDPFMKQVSHASKLVCLLEDSSFDHELTEKLSVQLSHSDGIRGFFVAYLTGEGSTAADAVTVPRPLVKAMEKANKEDLVSLACMNVVMPTAMVTMHTDETLSAASAKTAERGKRVLSVLNELSEDVFKNCAAIHEASTDSNSNDSDSDLTVYWKRFLDNYSYKDQQLKDITKTISAFL